MDVRVPLILAYTNFEKGEVTVGGICEFHVWSSAVARSPRASQAFSKSVVPRTVRPEKFKSGELVIL